MASKEYHEYLKSAEWGQIRADLFLLRGRKCERCQSSKKLQVHHLTYKNFGQEEPTDLEILCDVCHKGEHKILKPIKVGKIPKGLSRKKKRKAEMIQKAQIRKNKLDRKKRFVKGNFEKRNGVWYEKTA